MFGIFLSFAINWLLQWAAGGPNEALWLGPRRLALDVPGDGACPPSCTACWPSPSRSRRGISLPATRFRRPAGCSPCCSGEKNLEITIDRIKDTLEREDKPSLRDLKKPTGGIYGIVWVGLGLSIFQQFVGINVIFYYSNVLWQAVGFSADDSAQSTP